MTLAARKFSDCINRVRYHGTSFLLEKNGVPVARIVPVQPNLSSEFKQLTNTLRQARQSSPQEVKPAQQTPDPRDASGETKQNQGPVKQVKRPTLNW